MLQWETAASANARTSATKSIIRGINSNGTATFTYNADTLWQSTQSFFYSVILAVVLSYGSSGSRVGSHHGAVAGLQMGELGYLCRSATRTWIGSGTGSTFTIAYAGQNITSSNTSSWTDSPSDRAI